VGDGPVVVPEALLDEARQVNELIEATLAAHPSIHTRPAAEVRQDRIEGRGPFPQAPKSDRAVDRAIPGPGGPLGVRVVEPATGEVRGVYLHLHGGGWTLGAADQQDHLLEAVADRAGLVVASVDYRLAPEHPFPAAPDDCEAAARWLLEAAGAEWGTQRLVIGGESAGAHLAALTLLRLRDRHGVVGAFAGANLVFGAYDLGGTPSMRRWGDRNLILSTPITDWFCDQFLPGRSTEERRDPSISPLWADLHDLPPALFTVGTLDPILDDSLFMAARWAAAGNEAELRVYPESIHGFHAFPTGIAALALDAQVEFLQQVVA
jgi:acetyl esterase/lipase